MYTCVCVLPLHSCPALCDIYIRIYKPTYTCMYPYPCTYGEALRKTIGAPGEEYQGI